jgi:tetratricopeptide (TPR) repeat protein
MMAIGVLTRRGVLLFCFIAGLAFPVVGRADATLMMKNGTKIVGHIESVSDGQVLVTATAANGGSVKLPYQLSDIQSVDMPPPPELAQASGRAPVDLAAALAPLVKAYAGLPANWVIDAMGQLADAYTTLHQYDQANAIYAQIDQLYPNTTYISLATAGQAKVLLSEGKLDQALGTIQPAIDAANKTVAPSPDDAQAYARAFLVYGQILEAQKKYPEALEAYLTVKTLFYQNQSLVDQSAQLVQNLRAQQPGVSVE